MPTLSTYLGHTNPANTYWYFTAVPEHLTEALRAACDQTTRTGRRDYTMIALAAETGLRISELIGLTIADIHTGTGAQVHCIGKGRKQRRTPLLPGIVAIVNVWIAEHPGAGDDALLTTSTGRPLSRDAIERRIRTTADAAATTCLSLAHQHVTAHTLRHTVAMRLLHAGVATTVIALWLGDEQIATTNVHTHADMTIKENAIAKSTPIGTGTTRRYQWDDTTLASRRCDARRASRPSPDFKDRKVEIALLSGEERSPLRGSRVRLRARRPRVGHHAFPCCSAVTERVSRAKGPT